MFVDEAHDERCRSACLDCLLSFQAQNAMLEGKLNRPRALVTLSSLLEGNPLPQPLETTVETGHKVEAAASQQVDRPSNEERLRRVEDNRERRNRSQ